MSNVRTVLVLALSVLSLAAPLAAQTAVAVGGSVADPQGAAVAGAEVTLAPAGEGRSHAARTVADGSFAFDAVEPGEYVMVVFVPGFMTWSQPVTVPASAPLAVTLQLAGFAEDVTIEGALMGTVATGKTNMPLRELPMTVHGVTSQTIREQGANDLVAALQNVPGVNPLVNYGVYEYYAFRGFYDQDVQLVDGVRNEGNRINTQLANIERVEVLKGPSSALYGGGALGASVNLIRKKPSAQRAYDVMVAGGSFATTRGAFGATGRMGSDSILYRLDVGAEGKDGYRGNETERYTVTPSLAWRIADSNQLNIYYTFNRDRFSGDGGIPLLNTNNGTPTSASVLPDVPRDRRYNTPLDQAVSRDNNLQVAYARQFTDSIGFRNTLSYRHFDDRYFVAETMYVTAPSSVYREFLYFKHFRRPLTNVAEFTASVRRGPAQMLIIGWDSQRYRNRTYRTPGGGVAVASRIDLFNPVEQQPDVTLRLARIDHFTHNTNALYFQDHVTLTEKLKLLVGARYDIFRRSSHNDPVVNGEVLVGSGPDLGGSVTAGPLLKRDAEALTGRAGLVFQPVPQLDLYASLANSFRPLTQAQPDGSSLDPERGTQFELGQRLHLAGGRVQFNAAVYRIQRENVPFSRPGGVFEQAGKVRSRGVEADVQTTPVSNWRINGGYSFSDVEFLDYQVTAARDLTGRVPRFAPRHTMSVWTAYDWANGVGVNVGVRALSSVFGDDDNLFRVDGYGVANLGVRYQRGAFEYALNVNNLTNTDYITSVLYNSQVYPSDPVNVLATLRIRLR